MNGETPRPLLLGLLEHDRVCTAGIAVPNLKTERTTRTDGQHKIKDERCF
jgi:hypothetical protein